jgi:TolB-like protein
VSLPPGTIGLVVFPLYSSATDTTSTFLAEGMTDALTNAFAGLPGVRVVSRSALQAVMRDSAGFTMAAQKLGVPYYLEGAVQRAAGRIRVSVRLVDARDDLTLWSDVHESSDDDVLAAQSEVAGAIVTAFASGELVMRAARAATPN